MSDTAVFELKTNLDKDTIRQEVAQIWKGYDVDVSPYNSDEIDTIFCELLYVFGHPGEDEAIRKVVEYLLKIALEHKVYYYRCADFIPITNDQPLEITIDDIFKEEYEPSIGANIPERYLIRELQI